MSKARTLILRGPGTNCDLETAYAFEKAGAVVTVAHVNRLVRREDKLADYQIMVVPGGFSYGDDLGAGKILANELKLSLGEDIRRFFERGGLILGICNGLQVLVKADILPEPNAPQAPAVTLSGNDSGRFECRWVYLAVNPDSPCVFTRGIERLELPVANGEGKVVVAPEDLARLNVVLYYTDQRGDRQAGYPDNPSGSTANIAGISDSTGRV
ncbi:MAG: phosphoribosylformylglycinamidine synthase subunit PurQ, partial [Chloroflexota bacterium]